MNNKTKAKITLLAILSFLDFGFISHFSNYTIENKLFSIGAFILTAFVIYTLPRKYDKKSSQIQQETTMQFSNLQEQYLQLQQTYSDLLIKDSFKSSNLVNKEKIHSELQRKYLALENKCSDLESRLNSNSYKAEIHSLEEHIFELNKELTSLEKQSLINQYNFSEYDTLTSEECKNQLSLIKSKEKELISNNEYFDIDESVIDSKKQRANNLKQIIRCFNSECDNIILNLSVKTIDTARNKIARSFESLNSIFQVDGVQLTHSLLEYKLEELNLVYTYELKKEQEREQQRAIKEQMIEEEKVRREIERQKSKLEKDQTQCSNEIHKLMGYIQKTQDNIEKQLYIDKIKELEEKLRQLEADKETVLEREANARAGYVYVISNIGSFGDNIYKIGMTRRLEPMDRVKELGSASVPFEFDVHAMIFSDDAPALENALHQKFEKQSVNRVNLRKEFFHVSLDEIEAIVKEKYNNTVAFTRVPIAKEYNETLEILKREKVL